jgi:prolyl 4-hydroxylase
MVSINENWKNWISDNKQRGCTVDSMIEAMVKAGFDRAVAKQHVHTTPIRLATTVAAPGSYEYPNALVGSTNVSTVRGQAIEVLMQCAKPELVVFGNVFTAAECEELITRAKEHMKPSSVTNEQDGSSNTHKDRTSEGFFFQRCENEFISELDHRVAELMQMPVEHGEGFQVLRYGVGAEYKPHFDYFPPNAPGSKSHIEKSGQRVSTLVIYLNDVEEGGGTIFPSAGITVKAKRGNAVYFKYTNHLGQLDPLSLHGGTPVIAGEKWALTKWMRQRPY